MDYEQALIAGSISGVCTSPLPPPFPNVAVHISYGAMQAVSSVSHILICS